MYAKVRSIRGGLASRARETLFSFFSDNTLPIINNNASAIKIAQWKKKKQAAECYKKVFDKKNKQTPILLQLFEKVFAGNDDPLLYIWHLLWCCIL